MKLTLQPELLEDESLDSYVEYLADLHHCRPLSIIAIAKENNPSNGMTVARSAHPNMLDELQARTGMSREILLAATTTRYSSCDLHTGKATREHTWARKGFCSYCPECLDENQLRWSIPWYLRWTNICPKHNAILVDICPTCGRLTRSSGTYHPRRRESPTSKWNTKRCSDGCATEVLASATPQLINAASRAFMNQLWITRVISEEGAMCPYNDGDYLSSRTILTDLTILTRHALLSATTAGNACSIPGSQAPGDWSATIDLAALSDPIKGRPGFRTISTPRFLLAQTAAIDLLLTDPDDLPQSWLTKERADRLAGTVRRSKCTSISSALDRMLSIVRGFRDKQSTTFSDTMGRRRVQHSFRALKLVAATSIDASHLPATLWPEVTRYAPALPPRVSRTFPQIATIAVAAIGREPDYSKLAAQFGYKIGEKHARRALDNLIANELGTDTLGYLAVLQSHLLVNPPPIDYRRRRRLWPAPSDIGRNHTRQLARTADSYLTDAFRWKAQRFVWQLLTGNDPYITQGVSVLHGPTAYAYRQFLNAMTSDFLAACIQVAERLLLKQRINEPVTYAPDFDKATRTWRPGITVPNTYAATRTDLRRSSNSLAIAASAAGDAEELVHLALAGEKVTAIRLRNFVDTAHCASNMEMANELGIRRTQISREITFLSESLGEPWRRSPEKSNRAI